MQYQHPLIRKAISHYRYNEKYDGEEALILFFEDYQYNFKDYKRNKYQFSNFLSTLSGLPESTHITAKKLLWQGSSECWRFFERTAFFWTISANNEEYIDSLKDALEYALYVERRDLVEMLIEKTLAFLGREDYSSNKEHSKQPVYPSTYLAHFLAGKWIGANPALEQVLKYGKGYGIYQPLIDRWNDYSSLEKSYWVELCEYHLDQLSLTRPDQRDGEEFIGAGLIPMELINVFKVRKKLGLDVPEVDHELFKTPMAALPQIPTGYSEEYDFIYQAVKRTASTQKQLYFEEVMDYIRLNTEGEKFYVF